MGVAIASRFLHEILPTRREFPENDLETFLTKNCKSLVKLLKPWCDRGYCVYEGRRVKTSFAMKHLYQMALKKVSVQSWPRSQYARRRARTQRTGRTYPASPSNQEERDAEMARQLREQFDKEAAEQLRAQYR